jgi:hypothetical protein
VLKMTVGRSAVKLHHKDDAMTVAWDLDASLEGDELLEALRSIVSFMDAQAASPALPERIPGMALGMAQTAHPAPTIADWTGPVQGPEVSGGDVRPTNGWAVAQPEIPADRKGDWEYMPQEGE